MLGYTGAYVPENPFHLINPFENIKPPFEFVMKIAGINQRDNTIDFFGLVQGKELTLEKEPENKKNNKAIKILQNQTHLGYIQEGFVNSFNDWIDKNYKIEIAIYRVNGSEQYKNVYAFVSIN